MFEKQDEALGQFFRRVMVWHENLSQPWQLFWIGLVWSVVLLMLRTEIRVVLRWILLQSKPLFS
jgi:hypothetical protein